MTVTAECPPKRTAEPLRRASARPLREGRWRGAPCGGGRAGRRAAVREAAGEAAAATLGAGDAVLEARLDPWDRAYRAALGGEPRAFAGCVLRVAVEALSGGAEVRLFVRKVDAVAGGPAAGAGGDAPPPVPAAAALTGLAWRRTLRAGAVRVAHARAGQTLFPLGLGAAGGGGGVDLAHKEAHLGAGGGAGGGARAAAALVRPLAARGAPLRGTLAAREGARLDADPLGAEGVRRRDRRAANEARDRPWRAAPTAPAAPAAEPTEAEAAAEAAAEAEVRRLFLTFAEASSTGGGPAHSGSSAVLAYGAAAPLLFLLGVTARPGAYDPQAHRRRRAARAADAERGGAAPAEAAEAAEGAGSEGEGDGGGAGGAGEEYWDSDVFAELLIPQRAGAAGADGAAASAADGAGPARAGGGAEGAALLSGAEAHAFFHARAAKGSSGTPALDAAAFVDLVRAAAARAALPLRAVMARAAAACAGPAPAPRAAEEGPGGAEGHGSARAAAPARAQPPYWSGAGAAPQGALDFAPLAREEDFAAFEAGKAPAPPLPPVQSGHVSSIPPY